MLPGPLEDDERFKGHDGSAARVAALYLRRMTRLRHMDFDQALWQMLCLCSDPRRVYRSATYHRGTKHQWARDDPAFVVLIAYLLLVSTAAWCIGFGRGSPLSVLSLALYVLLVDFVVLGAALSTLAWTVANTYLLLPSGGRGGRSGGSGGGDERVEWLYAFDVHCNGLFVLSLLLHVLQYLLLPLLLRRGFWPALLSNTLYAAALSAYCYLTFLGYNELPFLRSTEVFVFPVVAIGGAYLVSVVLAATSGFSCTWLVASIYFTDAEVATTWGV
mmetsp:Transcript_48728/g.157858  ORF Transcript_48728/g.157858 Transcript_48728/m.157858 type:complete len:274 (-) Transcript_48728:93-914(-)